MSQDQIQLPEPVATVSKGPVAFFCKFTESGRELRGKFNVYTEETVRRLIAEAVAAEREACALACDEAKAKSRNHLFRSGLSIAAGVIRARSAAKSAGGLTPDHHSTQSAAHPGLCALDDAAPHGGVACDRLPERVPPRGLEREGFVSAQDHQSVSGDGAGDHGVLGGLEAGRSHDGGVAEGVKDGRGS